MNGAVEFPFHAYHDVSPGASRLGGISDEVPKGTPQERAVRRKEAGLPRHIDRDARARCPRLLRDLLRESGEIDWSGLELLRSREEKKVPRDARDVLRLRPQPGEVPTP